LDPLPPWKLVRSYYHRTHGKVVTEEHGSDRFALTGANLAAAHRRGLFYEAMYEYAPRAVLDSLGKIAARVARMELLPSEPPINRWLERHRLESCDEIAFDVMQSLLYGGNPFRLRVNIEDYEEKCQPEYWPKHIPYRKSLDEDTVQLWIQGDWMVNARTQTLAESRDQILGEIKQAVETELRTIYETAKLLGVSPDYRRESRRDATWLVLGHFHDLTPGEIIRFQYGESVKGRDRKPLRCQNGVWDIGDEDGADDGSIEWVRAADNRLERLVQDGMPLVWPAVHTFAKSIGLHLTRRAPGRPRASGADKR
jgi:hypothetical protein